MGEGIMNFLLPILGIAASALAQIFLKYAARYQVRAIQWFVFMGASLLAYGTSFFLYSAMLRTRELSKISPIMASAVALAVVLAGSVLFGENISLRRALGIAFGLAALYLLSS